MSALLKLAELANQIDEAGLHAEANKIDQVLKSIAQEQTVAKTYFQRDPKTNTFRGILEVIGTDNSITYMPEKPLVGKNMAALQAQLAKLVPGVQVTNKGVGEPWLTEVNMPFDAHGNRVAV